MPDGESIASFLSRVPKQQDPEKQALLEKYFEDLKSIPPPKCYHCIAAFKTRVRYERHVILVHSGKPAYPNLPYLGAMKIKPQGCIWEK